MSKNTREVTLNVKHLGLILKGFSLIEGKKPLGLSYKIGRITGPVQELQKEFIVQLQEYMENGHLKEDLTDKQRDEVEKLLEQEVTFNIPRLTITDVVVPTTFGAMCISDDEVLPYLVDVGIIIDDAEHP